ncbi:MAG: molybdopterin-dependent oxidoreductase [Roseinatronobacter sp.]
MSMTFSDPDQSWLRRLRWGLLLTGLLALSTQLFADHKRSFTLSVSGVPQAEITIADLAALQQTEIVTSTVWTEAVDRYTGILLADLLRHHDLDAQALEGHVDFTAIDGYTARIDFAMITDRAPVLAYLRNDEPMSLREQGPFWLIFPYDDEPDFRTESIYALSVWQVQGVDIVPR